LDYPGNLADLSGKARYQDARHIGAVAELGMVMVETVVRTPYLPFRVCLRLSAKAVMSV